MKKTVYLLLLAIVLTAAVGAAFPGQKTREKDLPPQYQEWLKLVATILQPVERNVFMKLSNNRDRDIFLEMFWKQRDPTPGTPANEYKDEMIKRFQYVNRVYGRSSVREGWQTDMGRFHMILGPPASTERFESSGFIVPCQAWTYYGDPARNLPNLFVLLFIQKGGVGDYKLYDAAIDGPTSLLMDKKGIDILTNEEIYDKIYELAPTLADLSITMIPGEIHYDYSPSPRNNIILAEILQAPKKDVNPSYATHFLEYKGFVSTEYMTNFVDSQATTALILDPQTGFRFLHFSVVPSSASFDFYEPKRQHFCNYQANVSLRVGEDIVFQYTRDFPIYIPEESLNRVQANGLAIEDSFPVAPGRFKLVILLMNSVGKEFCIVERDIVVPPDQGEPKIGGLLLGYKLETYREDIHIPFKVGGQKVLIEPKNVFSAADDIIIFFNLENLSEDLRTGGEVRIVVRGLRPEKPIERAMTVKLAGYPRQRVIPVSPSFPARELEPDYYEVFVSLVGADGGLVDEAKGNFVVSPASVMGHPIANAKGFPLANQFLYLYMLGQQEERLGRAEKAKELFERGFNLNPNYVDGVLMYAKFLIKVKDFDRALVLAERVRGDEKRQFEYYVTRGQALLGKELYDEAIASLLEANKMYNSDVSVLNTLGLCFYRTGQKVRALEALNESLKLNPDQAEVKRLVAEIEKNR